MADFISESAFSWKIDWQKMVWWDINLEDES